MPDLPTIWVTATQATRITAAFGSTLAYREWLRQAVIDVVLSKEGLTKAREDRITLENEIAKPT